MVKLPKECSMSDVIAAYDEYFKRAEEECSSENEVEREIKDRTARIASYMRDPGISEHDKDLQYALDYDVESPEEIVLRLRRRLDILTGKILGVEYESCGYMTREAEIQDIEMSLSEEAIAGYQAEYEAHLALREEAVAKGFVKHGNCRNVRR